MKQVMQNMYDKLAPYQTAFEQHNTKKAQRAFGDYKKGVCGEWDARKWRAYSDGVIAEQKLPTPALERPTWLSAGRVKAKKAHILM